MNEMISVIVPVYNVEKYLSQCLDSILGQTYEALELILVDDGSPDRSGAICDEYAGKDSRIRVIHQENRGQSAARNRGVAEARGEWICFVDSDDFIHPQMLELLYQAAQEEDCDISLCDWLEADSCPESFFEEKMLSCHRLLTTEASLLALYDEEKYPGWVVCCKLIRREIVTAYPFTEGRIYEDNEAATHWICMTPAIAKVPEALYFYRVNPESVTRVTFNIKTLDCLWALERMISCFSDRGYCHMAYRLLAVYVNTAVYSSDLLYEYLKLHRKARQVAGDALRFARTNGLCLSSGQKKRLWVAMHPWLRERHREAISAKELLEEQGFAALCKKLVSKMSGGNKKLEHS